MNRRLSLRTELLLNLSVLAVAALAIGVASVVLVYALLEPRNAALAVGVLVAADVCVLLGFVAYQVDKVVLQPLREAMVTSEAIAAGDLARRLPSGDTIEMANLSDSVNRMTDRLLEERAHLVRAEKMASVGRLAAGVAHEIGNPLGAITGYLHVLGTTARAGADDRDALAGLDREAARIDRIVRGLLDYTRARPSVPGAVDLDVAATTVVELLTSQGVLKNVRVELRTVPPPGRAIVSGERHDLEQALVNLLLNAVDAMEGAGTLSITVRRATRAELLSGTRRASDGGSRPSNPPSARTARWLESTTADTFVTIAVADSGPGIPPEDAERVFDPFYTTKPPGKGTGLGLAIVARAVDNAGGTIWVSRSREGGAAFRMLFAAAAESAPDARPGLEPSRRSPAPVAAQ